MHTDHPQRGLPGRAGIMPADELADTPTTRLEMLQRVELDTLRLAAGAVVEAARTNAAVDAEQLAAALDDLAELLDATTPAQDTAAADVEPPVCGDPEHRHGIPFLGCYGRPVDLTVDDTDIAAGTVEPDLREPTRDEVAYGSGAAVHRADGRPSPPCPACAVATGVAPASIAATHNHTL